MNFAEVPWWTRMLATDAPQLPPLWLMTGWLNWGWAVVTAWLGGTLGERLFKRRSGSIAVATACALWAWLPGPYASSHWLGLAFQAPSISTVTLCAVLLWDRFASTGGPVHGVTGSKGQRAGSGWAVVGLGLGACLAIDTFAVLPVSVYALGFSGLVVMIALAGSLLPYVAWGYPGYARLNWITPVAVALFVVLRLPTGNLWDALLDPWLAVGLAVYLFRKRAG